MQYGLMTYDIKEHFNVGDYIQSLAARQFLPQVDRTLNREQLHVYDGPPLKLIMNGWYMHHPEHWPPAPQIDPLLVSFHMTKRASATMLTGAGLEYLKGHRVGARDQATLELLHAAGVEAFFSGCLTLTLDKTYQHQTGDEVLIVDPLFKWQFWGRRKRILRQVLGRELVSQAHPLGHRYRAADYPTEEERFALADRLLQRYRQARLVVTSRLHCALPCLAMGTPVVLVDAYVGAKDRDRFGGLRSFLNTVGVGGRRIEKNFDMADIPTPTRHRDCAQALSQTCAAFVAAD